MRRNNGHATYGRTDRRIAWRRQHVKNFGEVDVRAALGLRGSTRHAAAAAIAAAAAENQLPYNV